ncbi:MAG: hypothetical protein KC418_21160 [Anaerolineales bacterium]|nr:hypothetical protein [Anaerolineales bacterium]MCB9418163.1 hypothetical protein [Ardenticatenaceae bacterium]
MNQLDLSDLGVLSTLQGALSRFSQDAGEAVRMAENEICQTQEWLQQRATHWQRQVEQARQEVARAQEALSACLNSGSRDRDGNYRPPDCSRQVDAVNRARYRLAECERHLQTAKVWQGRVEQSVNSYRREAYRLQQVTGGHTQKAKGFLQKALSSYQKVLEAANMVGIAGALVAGGVGFAVNAFVKGVNLLIGRDNQLMGDAAEQVAELVTAEELGLKVVEFDRKYRGFDRILQGPNGNYLVLESKKSDVGKLHLRADSYGHRQASAGWVEHLAQQMTMPGSEFYSPTNAAIGKQMLDVGSTNVPVIAAVTNPTSGTMDLYLRIGPDAMSADWTPLSSGIQLEKPE